MECLPPLLKFARDVDGTAAASLPPFVLDAVLDAEKMDARGVSGTILIRGLGRSFSVLEPLNDNTGCFSLFLHQH